MRNFDNVPVVSFSDDYGSTVLLTKEVCDQLGITKSISGGPITFGRGTHRVTLATPEWGQENLNPQIAQGSSR